MKLKLIILFLLISNLCFSQDKLKAICITHPYDGDTPEIIVDKGDDIYIVKKVRLYGIDTPEMKGEDSIKAKIAQKVLDSLIYMKELIFVPAKTKDKFGRLLGTIYVGKLNVNEFMLKYAKVYFGGKKEDD